MHSITLLPFDVWHEIFIQLDSHDDHETLVSATCIDRHVQSAAEAALHYSVAITNWRHVAAFAKCRPAARWTRHLSFSFPDRYDNEWFCKGVLPAYMLLAHLSTAQPRLFSLRVRSGLLCSLSQVHASFEDLHTSSQNGRRGPKSQVLPALQMVKNIAIIFEAWMGIPGLSTDHLEALLHCCRTYDRTLTAIQLENVPSGSGCLFSIVYTFLKERLVDFKVSLGAAQPYDELKREHLIDVLQLQGNVHLPMLRTLTLDETKRSYEIVRTFVSLRVPCDSHLTIGPRRQWQTRRSDGS